MRDVVVEDLEGHCLERSADGCDLGEYIDAIAVLCDHLFDATYLALNAVHAFGQGVFVALGYITVSMGCGARHARAIAGRKRRNLSELETTNTLEKAIVAAATIGLTRPRAASGTATTL